MRKLLSCEKSVVYYLCTNEGDDEYNYTRHASNSWTQTFGESEEQIYDEEKIHELEMMFQNYKNR